MLEANEDDGAPRVEPSGRAQALAQACAVAAAATFVLLFGTLAALGRDRRRRRASHRVG